MESTTISPGGSQTSINPSVFADTPVWSAALLLPICLGAWAASGIGGADWLAGPLATWTGLVVAAVGITAAYVDGRWHRLPNWLTYSAAAWGLVINAVTSLFPASQPWTGGVGFGSSLVGFSVLFGVLLIFFSFTGGGAGDVKLAGAIGALLGLDVGAEVMMYGFIAAGVFVAFMAVVRIGPLEIAKLLLTQLASLVMRGWLPKGVQPADADRAWQILRSPIPLGPFFAVGMVVAYFSPGF